MYLEAFQHKEMFHLPLKTLNVNKKSMTQALSSYTPTCKLCLMYSKVKLQ